MARRLAVLAATLVAVLLPAAPAAAHPLGNFTANTSARLVVGATSTRIDYVLDLAEIPTLQVRQRLDGDTDRYRATECAAIAGGLSLEVDGAPARLAVEASALTFPPGEANLPTLRLECTLLAATGPLAGPATIAYADGTRPDRIGWREVTAVGDGATLTGSDVPAVSLSDQLRAYPQDRLQSPLAQTSATLAVEPGGAAAADGASGSEESSPLGAVDGLHATLAAFVARQDLTAGVGLLALALAFGLGTLHALAPGHGKTVIAAYLVGRSGTVGDALQLGVTVAVTHTIGVLLLGLVLSVTEAVAPERLYPLLGVASGLLFAGLGLALLRRALASRRHHHDHHHEHPASLRRGLIGPGLAGGLVPSPSALLVLLGGAGLGRAGFAVVLVLAYGLGLGAMLVAAGWLLLRARSGLEGRPRLAPLWNLLPLVTAALVTLGGLVLATRAALAA